jgi:hypothetical protein
MNRSHFAAVLFGAAAGAAGTSYFVVEGSDSSAPVDDEAELTASPFRSSPGAGPTPGSRAATVVDQSLATSVATAGDPLRMIVARSEQAPADAFETALRYSNAPLGEQMVERVAAAWAKVNPERALESAAAIDDRALRARVQAAALREWVWDDPDAAFAYVESLDAQTFRELVADDALRYVVSVDPERMTEVAARLGNQDARRRIVLAATEVLARRSPAAALRFADTLPRNERALALRTLAPSYGRNDADAALSWARTENSDLVRFVLEGIASVDAERALALASTLPSQTERTAAAIAAGRAAIRNGDERATAARLAALPEESTRRTALAALVSAWGASAPHDAVDWLLAQPDRDIQGAFVQLGRQLGQASPETAQTYVARMPLEARSDWIAAVATGYAQVDPHAAAAWLEQFRGDPAYVRGANGVAAILASTDPRAAAQLLDAAGEDNNPNVSAAWAIAQSWAAKEPQAAAEWAIDAAGQPRRTQAVAAVMQRWAGDDQRAAHAWAFALPPGESRDSALAALLGASDAEETDRALLNGLSSREAQQQAVQRAAMPLAQRGRADAARAMIDAYVTDPQRRRSLEQALEQMRQQPMWIR